MGGAGEYDLREEVEMNMFTQLGGEKSWGDVMGVYNYLIGGHSDDGAKLFSELSGYGARGNGHKLSHGEF